MHVDYEVPGFLISNSKISYKGEALCNYSLQEETEMKENERE